MNVWELAIVGRSSIQHPASQCPESIKVISTPLDDRGIGLRVFNQVISATLDDRGIGRAMCKRVISTPLDDRGIGRAVCKPRHLGY